MKRNRNECISFGEDGGEKSATRERLGAGVSERFRFTLHEEGFNV